MPGNIITMLPLGRKVLFLVLTKHCLKSVRIVRNSAECQKIERMLIILLRVARISHLHSICFSAYPPQ
jgi:hypothetical protein